MSRSRLLFQVWQPMAGFMPPVPSLLKTYLVCSQLLFPSSPLAFYLGLGVVTLPSKEASSSNYLTSLIGAAIWATYRILKFDYHVETIPLWALFLGLAGGPLLLGATLRSQDDRSGLQWQLSVSFFFVRIVRLFCQMLSRLVSWNDLAPDIYQCGDVCAPWNSRRGSI